MDEIKNGSSIRIYGIIYKDIMRTKKLTGTSKLIYSYLMSFSGGTNKVFPGLDLMSEELGISKKTIIKHRKHLEEVGLLTVEKVITKNGSKNIYYLQDIDFRSDKDSKDKNENNIEIVPPKEMSNRIPYQKIIDYLNEKTGKNYRYQSKNNQQLIRARFKEGYSLDDFYKVIDIKTKEWKNNTEMVGYLRPKTLFSGNFDTYLNQEIPNDNQNAGGSYFEQVKNGEA